MMLKCRKRRLRETKLEKFYGGHAPRPTFGTCISSFEANKNPPFFSSEGVGMPGLWASSSSPSLGSNRGNWESKKNLAIKTIWDSLSSTKREYSHLCLLRWSIDQAHSTALETVLAVLLLFAGKTCVTLPFELESLLSKTWETILEHSPRKAARLRSCFSILPANGEESWKSVIPVCKVQDALQEPWCFAVNWLKWHWNSMNWSWIEIELTLNFIELLFEFHWIEIELH